MSIDAHVPSSATQTLAFAIGYVLLGLRVAILLCHTKIDHMDNCVWILSSRIPERLVPLTIGALSCWSPYQEVVWLDIAVDEVLLVDGLHACNLLEQWNMHLSACRVFPSPAKKQRAPFAGQPC